MPSGCKKVKRDALIPTHPSPTPPPTPLKTQIFARVPRFIVLGILWIRISRSPCAKSAFKHVQSVAGLPPPTRPPPALGNLHSAQTAVNIYVSTYIRGRPTERRSNAAFIFDLPLTRLAEASTLLLLLLRCRAGCRPPTSHMCAPPHPPSFPRCSPGEAPTSKFPLLCDTKRRGAAAFQRRRDVRVE